MTVLVGAPGCGVGALIGGGIALSSKGGSSARGAGAPLVDEVSPASGSHAGGVTITVTGGGFPSDASVTIGGITADDVVVVSPGELRATLPRAPLVGPVDVVVINPAGGAATLPDAFTYTNALPTAAVIALSSPQSQNIVFSITLADEESDDLDLSIAVSTDGVTFTSLPSSQFLSGGLTALRSSPGGLTHNVTWDSRAQFPAQNAAGVQLRAVPTDTTDDRVGASGLSNAFQIINNTAVRVELVRPGTDAFDVALTYRITEPDATDPVRVAGLTWIDLKTGAVGAMTVKSGQGLGPAAFSSSGATSTTVWRALADLGLGNSKLVMVTVSVTDGTYTTSATSAPFFVSNGPLSDQRVFDALADPEGLGVGDVLSAQRRLRLGPVVGGPFVSGERVTGTTSGAEATVRSVGTTFLAVDSETASFMIGETLTGSLDGDGARDDVVVALELVLQASGAVGGWEGLFGGPLGADIAIVRTSTFAPIAFAADAGDVVGADGIPDVVLSTNQPSPAGLSIYPGLGGGLFSMDAPLTRPIGSLTQVDLADLDGDGRLDVVCGTGTGAAGIKVFYGDGTGVFPAVPATIDASGAGLSVSVVVADVGGPLHPLTSLPMLDIVVTGFTSAEAGVLFQTAPRTFQGVALTVGGQPAQLAVGDLDGDGRADIAIPWGKDDVVAVYYQNPAPTGLDDVLFGPATFRTATSPLGVAILDVDGDGRLDLVVSARGADALNVFLQR